MEELSLEEVINKNGYVLYPFKGISMLPLLDEEFDIVKIIKADDYQISDIVLFKKPTGYVLHRIIDIRDNICFIKGDNASVIDEIKKENIIGKMEGYFHGNNYITQVNNCILPSFSLTKEQYILLRASHELFNFVLTKECNSNIIKKMSKEQLLGFIDLCMNKKMIYPIYKLIETYKIPLDEEYLSVLKVEADKLYNHYLSISAFEMELEELLTTNKIRFIYFKGSEIRKKYKYPSFRISNDIDFYIDPDNIEKALKLIKEHYDVLEVKDTNKAHVEITINDYGILIEMHFALFDVSLPIVKELFKDPFTVCEVDKNNPYRFHMLPEWYYLYNLLHTAKHISFFQYWYPNVLDTYISYKDVDHNKLDKLLKQVNLETFNQTWLEFVDMFINFKISESANNLLNLLSSSHEQRHVTVNQIKGRNKISFLLHRIFVSKDELRITYPNIDKYVIFLPIYEIRRWFLRMRKGRGKAVLKELKDYNNNYKDNLKQIGLDEIFLETVNG